MAVLAIGALFALPIVAFLGFHVDKAVNETLPRLRQEACDAYKMDLNEIVQSTKAAQTRFRFYFESGHGKPFFYVSGPGSFGTKGTLYAADLAGSRLVKPSGSNIVYLIDSKFLGDTAYFYVRDPCEE